MDRSRLKLFLAAVLFLVLAASAGSLLAVGGKALFLVERGGTAAPIENAIVDLEDQEPGRVTWLPDAPTVARTIDAGTRERIADGYLRGWRQIEQALATCTTRGLGMYFGPGPQAQLEALIADARADGCSVRRSDGAHRLRLTFVSEDGGLVAITDERHWYVDRLPTSEGAHYVETTSARDLVLRLDDGEWRVTVWDQRPVDDESWSVTAADRAGAGAPSGLVGADGRVLTLDGEAFRPEGINYYPAETPWRAFWAEYDPSVIDTDMARAHGLGFDAVRVFVPFGSGAVRPSDRLLDDLDDLLSRAADRGIRVVVTLFDLDFDYRPSAWIAADRYLERLLTRFADEPAILAWDLKNEPDLDDAQVGRPLVDAWLRHVIATARRYDPDHLLTIGWSDARWASRHAESLDLISVHDYGDPSTLPDRLRLAADSVPTKPLWLSEYGAASWQSPLAPGGLGEAGQASYLAAIRDSLASLPAETVAGQFMWSLRDYDLAAPAPDGVRPWRRGVQRTYGLIALDGGLKPAAAVVRGVPAPEPTAPQPYLIMLAVVSAWGVVLAGFTWWRRRTGVLQASMLVVAHPAAYVVVGLILTVVSEALRLDPTWLPVLAVVAWMSASVSASMATALVGRLGRRLLARVQRLKPSRSGQPDAGASTLVDSSPGLEL